jgi:hypothetical protein
VGIREQLASADDHPLLLGWMVFKKELTNLWEFVPNPLKR